MLVDTKDIKEVLYKVKQEAVSYLDRSVKSKVRYAIDARITVIDNLFMWLDKSEKQGVLDMENLKLGELTTWEPHSRKGSIDEKIIEDSKALKKNYDAVKVKVGTVNLTTFTNRVYQLRKEKKIADNIVPRKDKEGNPFLVYLDEPNPKRSKGK